MLKFSFSRRASRRLLTRAPIFRSVVVGNGLYGNIAEVGVYRNTLTAAEVEGLSRHGLWPITDIPSVAYVHEVSMPSSALQADLVASCVTAGFALVPETLADIFALDWSEPQVSA